MTDNADTLTIFGDNNDTLYTGAGWSDDGIDGSGYHIYTQGSGPNSATLVVDTDVVVLV